MNQDTSLREMVSNAVDATQKLKTLAARGLGGLVLGAGVGAICMILVDMWLKYVAPRLSTEKK